MDVKNPPNMFIARHGEPVRIAVLPIGSWNMDVQNGVNVAHTITVSTITHVSAVILHDNNAFSFNLISPTTPTNVQGGISIWGANISVYRRLAGFFDNANFNDGVMNRGYVTVFYIQG